MKKILTLFLLSSCLIGQSSFQIGDKWVYEKKSISGSDTTSSWLIKELFYSWPGINKHYVLIVNDHPFNDYWLEEWDTRDGIAIIQEDFERKLIPYPIKLYDKNEEDFYRDEYYASLFSYTITEKLFDTTIITYQYRGTNTNNISNVQSKYSPETGLIYLSYFHPDTPYLNYYYNLKAAKIGGKIYGNASLLNLWMNSEFTTHASFHTGDKWVYERNNLLNNKTSIIEKVLTDESGVLSVKEFPGESTWTEKWEITPDSAFMSFTVNTMNTETREKVYSSRDTNYYFKMITVVDVIANMKDEFLNEILNYQHRYYYNYGYFRMPTPKQTETIYSPQLGLLFMYYLYSKPNMVLFKDSYQLKAAKISGKIYGDKTFLDSPTDNNSEDVIVTDFVLEQNFPNPFNPVTTISYSIPSQSFVELKVYDMLGREVTTLVSKEQIAGEYNLQFNASSLPSGVYEYSLKAGEYNSSRKLVLLK